MNDFGIKDVFKRSGLAALSDLESSECQRIFSTLEIEQHVFLEKEAKFRSDNYKWPRDPLHNWSRLWEYPYVYYHLAAYINTLPKHSRPTVADVGSGATFFPFSLAKLGYRVLCTDIDPVCERDLSLAREHILHSPGTVDFRLIKDSNIPFEDSECDAIYCISVLEHISDFEKTVTEMARILKPEGLCLITCDINLQPEDGLQFDLDRYERLRSIIEKFFVLIWPERTVHPVNILTTKNSLYPLKCTIYGVVRMGCHIVKQKIIKPLLGRKSGNIRTSSPHVAVLGLALKKRM